MPTRYTVAVNHPAPIINAGLVAVLNDDNPDDVAGTERHVHHRDVEPTIDGTDTRDTFAAVAVTALPAAGIYDIVICSAADAHHYRGSPQATVAVIETDTDLVAAFEAGCAGTVRTTSEGARIRSRLTQIALGRARWREAIDPDDSDQLDTLLRLQATRATAPTFGPRALEVLTLAAEGHTNDAIAAALHISVNTVESHAHNIRERFGTNMAGAVAAALRHGIIT